VTRRGAIFLILGLLLMSGMPRSAAAQQDAETRVLDYIRTHLKPGEPLLVTDLYNKAFTEPAERKALGKLYSALFRIPLFAVQYQEQFAKPPSLRVIAEQFDLQSPEAADVLLRVLESDPRVPNFLTRDPHTHEITRIDKDKILADPRFGQAITRHLGGWEGQPAPEFRLASLDGAEVNSANLRGKTVLLYIWFTGCPPCMEEARQLDALDRDFSGRGVVIVGANADHVLGLSYDDAARHRYIEAEKLRFPIVNWTRESDAAYGSIAIFPTLFLIDTKGVIIRHWVRYVSGKELRGALEKALAGPKPSN
jgi:peroxiredoxin